MTVTAITLAISAHAGATSANEVVIASTGGAYDRALKEAWFDPFTEQTGIRNVARLPERKGRSTGAADLG